MQSNGSQHRQLTSSAVERFCSAPQKLPRPAECCAPFILKNYQKHTLEYPGTNLGWFGNFWFWVKFWLMRGLHTQKFTKVSQANSGLIPWILSTKYSRIRLRSQVFKYSCVKVITSRWLISENTFALIRISCPSGPPCTTTEESAAHHLYQKTIKNIL